MAPPKPVTTAAPQQRRAAPAPAPQQRRAAPAPEPVAAAGGPLVVESIARAPLAKIIGAVTEVDAGYLVAVRRRGSSKTDDFIFDTSVVLGVAIGAAGWVLTDDPRFTGAAFATELSEPVFEEGVLSGIDANGCEVVLYTDRLTVRHHYPAG